LFSRFKEKLSGFKEALSTKIAEKASPGRNNEQAAENNQAGITGTGQEGLAEGSGRSESAGPASGAADGMKAKNSAQPHLLPGQGQEPGLRAGGRTGGEGS